jgi:hypothetical protein
LACWVDMNISRETLYHGVSYPVESLHCCKPIQMYAKVDTMTSDSCPLLFLQIISKVMWHFLRGIRVADQSVPAQVVLKFSSIMTRVAGFAWKAGIGTTTEGTCKGMSNYLL